jgi:hypothetical protein
MKVGGLLLAALAVAGVAHAKVSVGVLAIPGPHGAATRRALERGLSAEGFHVVEDRVLDRAARPKRGHPLKASAIAAAAGAEFLVEARDLKGHRTAAVQVLSGLEIGGEALVITLDKHGFAKLRTAIIGPSTAAAPAPPPAAAAPPPADAPVAAAPPQAASLAPAPVPSPPVHTESPPSASTPVVTESLPPRESPPAAAGTPLVDVMAGAGFLRRQLSYTDDIFQALDSYRLVAGLSLEAEASVFPFARGSAPVLSNLGVEGRYNREPGLASVDAAGDQISTLSDAWEFGGMFRGSLAGIELDGTAAYARQRFEFHVPPGAQVPVIPAVSYSALRLGGGARIPFLSVFAGLLEADYLPVFSSGQMASAAYFPRSGVAAVQGRAGLCFTLFAPFEARVLVDYRRYFYAMNPQPGDPYIAGGALDEYLTVTAGVAARL